MAWQLGSEDDEEEMREWLALKMVTGRFSSVLVRQLAFIFRNRLWSVYTIFDEIGSLEGAAHSHLSHTKPATKYRHPPLAGLRHKHFTQASFMADNIKNHWSKGSRLDVLVGKVMDDSSLSPEQATSLLAHKIVLGGYESRSRERSLTGECIVYDARGGRNTYLTLAEHKDKDPDCAVYERVRQCFSEFPDLEGGLAVS